MLVRDRLLVCFSESDVDRVPSGMAIAAEIPGNSYAGSVEVLYSEFDGFRGLLRGSFMVVRISLVGSRVDRCDIIPQRRYL